MCVDRRVAPRDRRQSPRVPLTCAVRNRTGAQVQLCLAANISRSGMEVVRVRDAPLSPATTVTLEFELPGRGDLVAANGVVIFDRDGARTGATGVRFQALTPEHARLIDEYVREAAAR